MISAAEGLDDSTSILHMDLGIQRRADPPLHAEAANFTSSVAILLRSLLDNDNPPNEVRQKLSRYVLSAEMRAQYILDLDQRKQKLDTNLGLLPFKTTLKRLLVP